MSSFKGRQPKYTQNKLICTTEIILLGGDYVLVVCALFGT